MCMVFFQFFQNSKSCLAFKAHVRSSLMKSLTAHVSLTQTHTFVYTAVSKHIKSGLPRLDWFAWIKCHMECRTEQGEREGLGKDEGREQSNCWGDQSHRKEGTKEEEGGGVGRIGEKEKKMEGGLKN